MPVRVFNRCTTASTQTLLTVTGSLRRWSVLAPVGLLLLPFFWSSRRLPSCGACGGDRAAGGSDARGAQVPGLLPARLPVPRPVAAQAVHMLFLPAHDAGPGAVPHEEPDLRSELDLLNPRAALFFHDPRSESMVLCSENNFITRREMPSLIFLFRSVY